MLYQGKNKTSGETKLKGLKLQGRQFWLKIKKPRVGRRCPLQLPAHHPVGATGWEQAEHRLFQHHPARRHRGVSPGTQMPCTWLIPSPASSCITHSLFWLVGETTAPASAQIPSLTGALALARMYFRAQKWDNSKQTGTGAVLTAGGHHVFAGFFLHKPDALILKKFFSIKKIFF